MSPEDDAPALPPLDLTAQEPIPPEGVRAALELLQSGKLHRYGEASAVAPQAALLEAEFARELGVRYCVAMNSCGSTLYVGLRVLDVQPGDTVLSNCFTLAPVPGAVAHAGAKLALVDITEDLTIDLDDLERKAATSGARVLLLSHMRGHIADMQAVSSICRRHDLKLIEDCAHTMGASWAGQPTGTWGKVGCFSVQSYKHANGGEGGLLATNDDDMAARAILFSGSYMHWRAHQVRPADAVFERWKYLTPNFSLRMSNLVAAIVRPQLGSVLAERCRRWNALHDALAAGLSALPGLRLPRRPPQEAYVQSSIQFMLDGWPAARMARFAQHCAQQGVNVKWFGNDEPHGFTSTWAHWQFASADQALPQAQRILAVLCDLRIPLSLTPDDVQRIVRTVEQAMQAATQA